MKAGIESHNFYLDELVNRLKDIDEDKRRIQWIMKDGLWFKKDSYEQFKLCDLVIAYYDLTAVPVELKGSWDKKCVAKEQLRSSYTFIDRVLGLKCYFGKIVVYNKGQYEFDTVVFRRRKTGNWR